MSSTAIFDTNDDENIIIFDLDGTLSNLSHRLHFIQDDNQDWDSFFNACDKDEPIWNVISMYAIIAYSIDNEYNRKTTIEIWSGRDEMVKEKTVQWLLKHGISADRLRMRKHGDHRLDYIVKQEWLDELKLERPNAKILAVFEDRDSVCQMWRNNGITCYQVANGNY